MKTNLSSQKAEGPFTEKKYAGVQSEVGDEIAFFHLGSSIVLVFESPEFMFTVKPGQKVKVSAVYFFGKLLVNFYFPILASCTIDVKIVSNLFY